MEPSHRFRALPRRSLDPLILAALATGLNVWNLSVNGFGNPYYAAAVRSMYQNLHNFLYVSMDPSGLMTIDKPPLAFWLQVASVHLFGFNAWGLLLPQAAEGVLAVLLIYALVRRYFGRGAGLLAGAALALTPTIVAVARDNNPDMLLVLLSVATMYCALRALEPSSTRVLGWAVGAGVCIGLGFETKMAAALVPVPSILVAWVLIRPGRRTLIPAAAGSLAAGAIAVAWPLLVALTPSTQRPWVSSTSNNSIWQLIFGYNGIGRLLGRAHPGTAPTTTVATARATHPSSAGPLRLLHSGIGDQIAWLLGAALVALIVLVAVTRLRRQDPRTAFVAAVGSALVFSAAMLSFSAGTFHPYYTAILAPWIAALFGAGVSAVRGLPSSRTVGLVPTLVALGGLATEAYVLHTQSRHPGWAFPLLAITALLAVAVGLTLALGLNVRASRPGTWLACAALLIVPAWWSLQTTTHAEDGIHPAGGPVVQAATPRSRRQAARTQRGILALEEAARYAADHGGGTVAIGSQLAAATLIIHGYENVAGIGGFTGVQTSVSPIWLSEQVADHRLSFVKCWCGHWRHPRGRAAAIDYARAVGTPVLLSHPRARMYDLVGKAAVLGRADRVDAVEPRSPARASTREKVIGR